MKLTASPLVLRFVLLTCFAVPALSQPSTGTLLGRATDAETGQPLPGATIIIEGTTLGTAANAFGRYTLRGLPAGEHVAVASFVGYGSMRASVSIQAGTETTADFELKADLDQIGEVVVRSQKFVRNLQDTQESVGVVTDTEIQAIPMRDWEDATLLMGNVSTSGSGTFNIRGVGNNGIVGGRTPVASIYIDGVQQGLTSSAQTIRGTWDLESVEVFRGPQSTTSGRNALAGAVYLRSASPTFDWSAAGRVAGGSPDLYEAAVTVNAPLIQDQLAVRLSAETGGEDSGVTFVNVPSDVEDFERTNTIAQRNVRARLLATPRALSGLTVLLSHSSGFDRPVSFIGVSGPNFEERITRSPFAFFSQSTLHNTGLEASYDITPTLTFTSVTGRLSTELNGSRLLSDNPEFVIPLVSKSNLINENNLTQELRFNYETARTRAVLGVYLGSFERSTARVDEGDVFDDARPGIEDLFGPVDRFRIILTSDYTIDVDTENRALFGELNHEIIDGLTLTAGLRYDQEEFEELNVNNGITGRVEDASPAFQALESFLVQAIIDALNLNRGTIGAEFTALLPKFGAKVDLTPDISLGANVQRGYRAGGSQVETVGGINQFDPEFTWNYELSFRSRLVGGRLTANANLFYTDWRDQQVSIPVPGTPFFRTENAGASTLYGGEIELRAVPSRGMTLYSSLGITRTEFDEFLQGTRDLSGLGFPGSPGETLSAGVIYDRGRGFFGAANVAYAGEYFSIIGTIDNPDGTVSNDPRFLAGNHTTVDARAGYTFDFNGAETRIAAFARNLFDATSRDFATTDVFGDSSVSLLPPRVVGVGIQVDL